MAANLLPLDTALAKAVKFTIGVDKKVEILFQFPPKILVDGRTGSWEEVEIPGDQPVSVYKTSGARKMTLEWTYVIGASKEWDTNKVRQQIVNLRSYYTKRESLASGFIVTFLIWKLGGEKTMTCRLGNIDVSHGKALYVPTTGSEAQNIAQAHPVMTTIKVAIQPWISGGSTEKMLKARFGVTDEKATDTDRANAKSKIDLKALSKIVPTDWQ